MSANEVDEKLPLLQDKAQSDNKSLHIRFFVSICLIMLLFRGSEEMASVTIKQFIYSWCQWQVNTKSTHSENSTDTNNTTDACGNGSSKHKEKEAQEMASQWELYFNVLNAVIAFFAVSILGTVSDFVGRKPFLCLAILGYTLKCGIVSLVIYYDLHIAYILVGYGIDGMCGSTYATSLYCYSGTADLIREKNARVLGIALVETVLGIGKLTTEFGNGYFIQDYGYFYPMLTSASVLFFSFILGLLFFVETKKIEPKHLLTNGTHEAKKTVNSDKQDINATSTSKDKETAQCSTLFRNFTSFYLGNSRKDKTIFWLCLTVFWLQEVNSQGRSDPLPLYQLGSPFCWSSKIIGWYNAMLVAVTYVLGLLLLKPLQLCLSANILACIGLVSGIAFNAITGLASTTIWLFAAIGFGIIMVLPKAILRGITSSRASKDTQGALFAGLQSSELACKLVASPLSLSIYSHTLDTMKGLVFLVLAGINVLSLVFMLMLTRLLNKERLEMEIVVVPPDDRHRDNVHHDEDKNKCIQNDKSEY